MRTTLKGKGVTIGSSLAVALGMVFAVALSAAFLAAPAFASPAPGSITPATGATQQWAFGGVASAAYSCSDAACFGGNASEATTISLSFQYYIEWVVIYTVTNVSASQTMIEGQAALNASASLSLNECVASGTSAPCNSDSISANVAGLETSVGFTNITTGTVFLTPSGSGTPGNVPAWAIMNGASNESFNFSGSYNVNAPSENETGSASFSIGASEVSSVTFSTPLGTVPLNPSPGDTWNGSAPFSASGAYTSGYGITYTTGTHSGTENDYTSGHVSPSGDLDVNGTDVGAVTLYDNYTNPPTSVTAQAVVLDFGDGTFVGSDGWIMIPSGLYAGYTGVDLLHTETPAFLSGAHPSQGGLTGAASGESAYYEQGVGFVGASEGLNASSVPVAPPGSTAPSLNLQAGPEPVSVAQGQYSSIVAGGGSGSKAFPYLDLVLVVVVVGVVVVACGLVWARSSRGRPPAGAPPYAPPVEAFRGVPPPPPPT
jgi:hypothetical protein